MVHFPRRLHQIATSWLVHSRTRRRASRSPSDTLPDFVIIGTMKSGTTTLCRWLDQHPEIYVPSLKEPNFFSHDRVWRRGLDWYRSVFADAPPGLHAGEASVTYTDPAFAERAAERLHRTLPGARLTCVLRHPVERLRSHYRHEVQRARERRSFLEAITRPGNAYVERSRYATCLRPWVDRFGDQLHVIRLEDLVGGDESTWAGLLRHLRVAPAPRPHGAFNVTANKDQFTGAMRLLWDAGLVPRSDRIPVPLRSMARRFLLRSGGRYAQRIADSARAVPTDVVELVWEDVSRLPALCRNELLRWRRTDRADATT